MFGKHKTLLIRLVAFVLVLSICAPTYANASDLDTNQQRGSFYLEAYNTYVCAMGGGKLEIWYTVIGVNTMDEIGTLSIKLYESVDQTTWTRVKTYSHENYPMMLARDEVAHSSCVTYYGIPGRYYKAYVCIWAGKDGDGDTRYMWTSVEHAT